MSEVRVFNGDSREILKVLDDACVDAVVTDPPYALVSISERYSSPDAKPTGADVYARATAGFMGRSWDTGETAFAVEFWAEVYRVLKPGGYVVAFGGTRTYHRLACAIEDAGFEIRDQLAWLYGTGFPKSADMAKSVDKWVGAEGSYGEPKSAARAGWIERGSMRGAGGEQGYQRPWMDDPEATERNARHYLPGSAEGQEWDGWGTALKPAIEPIVLARKPLVGNLARNVLAHGCGALNIDACRIDAAGWPLIESRSGGSVNTFGDGLNGSRNAGATDLGRWPANVLHDGSDEVVDAFPDAEGQRGQVGGDEPSASGGDIYNPRERTAGGMPRGDAGSASRFFYSAKADTEDRFGSDHPTVKPVDLIAWLVRLVCRKGGVVLDPFAGSGTTGLAALREGCDAILIEREADHAEDIRRRLAWARGEGKLTQQEMLAGKLARNPAKAGGAGTPLFGGSDEPEISGGGVDLGQPLRQRRTAGHPEKPGVASAPSGSGGEG